MLSPRLMEKAPLFIREASGAPLNQQLLPLGPAPPSTLVIRPSHTGPVVGPAPPRTLTSLFLPQGLCTACPSAATRPPSLPSLTPFHIKQLPVPLCSLACFTAQPHPLVCYGILLLECWLLQDRAATAQQAPA